MVTKKSSEKIDFLRLSKERKTTYEFNDKKVSDVALNKLLEAGRWAPSCSNLQPWHFIIIRDGKVIDKITDLCAFAAFHGNPSLMIAYVLEHCAPEKHLCGKGKVDDYITIGQPALNMIYQAQTMGIGSCYLSPKTGLAEKVLKVPAGMEVAVVVGFGYEKKGAFQKKRTRKQIKEIVHYEQFGKKNA